MENSDDKLVFGSLSSSCSRRKRKKVHHRKMANSEAATITSEYSTDRHEYECIAVNLASYKPFSVPLSPGSSESITFGEASKRRSRLTLLNPPEVQLRFLNPGDVSEVKHLCKEWFPVEYPDSWYSDITSNDKFYAVACVLKGQIVGLVVAEIKDAHKLPKEDSNILALSFSKSTKIGYILSLGVVKEYRENGIASFMLENLIAHLTSEDNQDVKAIYLHVLTTNIKAISFYEHRGFRPHLFLPYYYAIKGKRKDGFTYVLYLNGGHPPWGVLDYMAHICGWIFSSLNPWLLAKLTFRKINVAFFNTVPRLRQIAHSSTAVFS